MDGPTKVDFALTPPARITLGRHPDNAIHLTDEPRISRYHAEFICTGGDDSIAWFVVDLGSRHGTILNGVQLVANKLYPI